MKRSIPASVRMSISAESIASFSVLWMSWGLSPSDADLRTTHHCSVGRDLHGHALAIPCLRALDDYDRLVELHTRVDDFERH